MILARCGVAKKRAKLLRTSLYASSLALFLLLARRQNHCAKLSAATETFFAFTVGKAYWIYVFFFFLSNGQNHCAKLLSATEVFFAFYSRKSVLDLRLFPSVYQIAKIIAPNYRPRLKLFFVFYSRKSVLDLRLFPPVYKIAKIIAPNYLKQPVFFK